MAGGCVDLIYLDPPFNSNADYAAPIGSEAAGAEFKDTWGLSDIDLAWWGEIEESYPALYQLLAAVRDVHSKSMMSYLIYMAVRVIEMRRLLKSTGSIYLHCNQFAGQYLKLMMDCVFGRTNFINEIIWNYGTPSGGRSSGRKPVKVHDTLIVFAAAYGNHLYNRQYTPYSENYVKRWFRHDDGDGRMYQTRSRKGKIVRQYLDESPGMPLSTVWSDVMQLSSSRGWFPGTNKEETGYPTQKPLALLERILRASSNEGDWILDPFCGCATTCVSADALDRNWIGIDISAKAAELVRGRIDDITREIIHRTDIPTDRKGKRSKDIKHTLYGRQEGKCTGCLSWFPFRNMTLDHKTPRSKGGPDTDDNLQLLCGACNSKKGSRTMEELIAALTAEGIRQ